VRRKLPPITHEEAQAKEAGQNQSPDTSTGAFDIPQNVVNKGIAPSEKSLDGCRSQKKKVYRHFLASIGFE